MDVEPEDRIVSSLTDVFLLDSQEESSTDEDGHDRHVDRATACGRNYSHQHGSPKDEQKSRLIERLWHRVPSLQEGEKDE